MAPLFFLLLLSDFLFWSQLLLQLAEFVLMEKFLDFLLLEMKYDLLKQVSPYF